MVDSILTYLKEPAVMTNGAWLFGMFVAGFVSSVVTRRSIIKQL